MRYVTMLTFLTACSGAGTVAVTLDAGSPVVEEVPPKEASPAPPAGSPHDAGSQQDAEVGSPLDASQQDAEAGSPPPEPDAGLACIQACSGRRCGTLPNGCECGRACSDPKYPVCDPVGGLWCMMCHDWRDMNDKCRAMLGPTLYMAWHPEGCDLHGAHYMDVMIDGQLVRCANTSGVDLYN